MHVPPCTKVAGRFGEDVHLINWRQQNQSVGTRRAKWDIDTDIQRADPQSGERVAGEKQEHEP